MDFPSKPVIFGVVVLGLAGIYAIKGKSSSGSTPTLSDSGQSQTSNPENYNADGSFSGAGETNPYLGYFSPTYITSATPASNTPQAFDVNKALYGPGYIEQVTANG